MVDLNENATFIGFDFGTKKIGVAVGQTITLTANPLQPLPAIKGVPKWEQIASLVTKWNPKGFIVGIPLNMDATSQPLTAAARKFAMSLYQRFTLPVYEVDERLTTVEAKQQLFEWGGYKALKDISIDCFAAKLILEAWLRNAEFSKESKKL